MDVTETWSVDATMGVSYVGLQFSATVGWEKSVSQKVGQTVTMSIPPGKMVWISPPFLSQHTSMTNSVLLFQGALTVSVSYKKTHGNMRIDSE